MIPFSKIEIEKFKTKTIKAIRLYIDDVTEIDGEKYRKYLLCLLKKQ